MIDLHTHILHGLDDGPPDLDGSVAMARAAVRAGTTAVATTSHINVGFGLTTEHLRAARAELAERLERDGIPLELLAGGEVAPEKLPDLDDATLRAVTLGGGDCILLECPFPPVGAAMEPMVADLHRRGFTVLLAHPERSASFQQDPGRLRRLVDMGAWAQVTSGALDGGFGERAQRAGMAMLEAGLVHVLASDSHDPQYRPPDPRLADRALAERYGDIEEQLAWMTEAAPAALVAGTPLPPRPALPRARGMRARLRSWSAR
ncbi:MAG: protein-tyrosine phosphatase [Miltoncostaeaceae bacterium]|nr:protein-tyrosine phosphatase [Miltoncostaeaceae bacterium]